MTEVLTKFQDLLRELFQFDSADLDFGIYRIMNHKRDVVDQFITQKLPDAVKAALSEGALGEQAEAAKNLQGVISQIKKALGEAALDEANDLKATYHDTPLGQTYLALKAQAAGAGNREALEAGIFNHLYSFFSRYYQDGDFISKRRYSKKERYAIPYNGEEVTLYWANHDQYYIKTGEYFTDYTWKAPNGVTVHFKVQAADVEQNNVKGDKRFFVPQMDDAAWDKATHTFTLPFEFRPLSAKESISYGTKNQQANIIAKAVEAMPKRLAKLGSEAQAALSATRNTAGDDEPMTWFEHHLRQYTRRNTSDFFIHKDLKGFLSRELDFYLKNEVLNLDELDAAGEARAEGWFQMMRTVKRIGGQIIDFLAQIEDFQKMLWEKRKFVTETFYCVSVGQIAEAFYGEIAGCEAQWDEWKQLGFIDAAQKALATYSGGGHNKRVEWLKTHPALMIDTRHFEPSFVDRLLAGYNDLDAMTDGLLVHSENWQALNLLKERFTKTVRCIYIDPPYNTGNDGFLYKDAYQHSTWLAMMQARIIASSRFLTESGLFFTSIDDIEIHNARRLLDDLYGSKNFVGTLTWISTTQPDNIGKARFGLQQNIEYILLHSNTERVALPPFVLKHSGVEKKYPHLGKFGSCRFEIIERAFEGAYARPTMQFKILGRLPREGKQWQIGEETARELETQGKVEIVDEIVKRAVYPEDELDFDTGLIPFWAHLKESGTSQTGKAELTAIVGKGHSFDTVKPTKLISKVIEYVPPRVVIADFFAGSGATGHSVIISNRGDGGERKFFLIEMAHHFDKLLLQRIKKIAYSPDWDESKPKRDATAEEAARGPRILKVIRLESYEDALNNITFEADSPQAALQFEDYLLQYMLAWETRHSDTLLNVKQLANPLSYQLRIHRNGETRTQPVDLAETFNYLLGLRVKSRTVLPSPVGGGGVGSGGSYLIHRGETREGRNVVVIWRNTEGWQQAEYERDRDFVAAQKLSEGADDVYVNGDSLIAGAQALDGLFKARMFAPVEA